MRRCSGFAVTEIAAGDLDMAIVRKLAATKFPLGDQFEPGPMKVVGFEAAFRRGGVWQQDLEHAPRYSNDAFIIADADAPNSTTVRSGFHRASGGKRKNMRYLPRRQPRMFV
jgi:hypothetical protein